MMHALATLSTEIPPHLEGEISKSGFKREYIA